MECMLSTCCSDTFLCGSLSVNEPYVINAKTKQLLPKFIMYLSEGTLKQISNLSGVACLLGSPRHVPCQ